MEDVVGHIAAIIASIFVLFFLPLVIISQKMDTTSQAYIDNAVVEFVDNARATGKISDDAYENLCLNIDKAQSNCFIKITHDSKYCYLDSGEVKTAYYTYNKNDILGKIYTAAGANKDYEMKNGDFITVTVYNQTPTLGTMVYRLLAPGYNPSGRTIYSTYSGYVGNNPE